MRTKRSKLPSAKPQIALLAMALVISSGAVYAQMHRGQSSGGSASQSAQSLTTASNSSFTQPAQLAKKVSTLGHVSARPQIAGGSNEDD